MRGIPVWLTATAIAALALLAAAPAAADSLQVDLGRISRDLETRYHIAETGELPLGVILIGAHDDHPGFFFPNFLRSTFDLDREIVEYDVSTGARFSYTVPGYRRFIGEETRDGPWFVRREREIDPAVEVEVRGVPALDRDIRARVLRKIWREEIKYNLGRDLEAGHGRGLISIDIPISLPKQIERIIGRGEETNLSVSGRESIRIGGESNWCSNCPQTEGRPTQQKFPDLDMEQQLTVNLHGNIGEKINVAIDHSSAGGGAQSVNRVRLNYTGFDDEIIQLIEMGDTDLTLTGAQLISYSGSAKGLFGVKAVAQIGPLDLTVIASKEEGESASGTYTSSGGAAGETRIPDYGYVRRQYFYLECPGESFAAPNAGFGNYAVVGGADEVEVFVSLRDDINEENTYEGAKYNIIAYEDPGNDGIDEADRALGGFQRRFKKLEWGVDYDYIQQFVSEAVTKYIGLRLFRSLDDRRALVVRYKMTDGTTETTVGDYLVPGIGSEAAPLEAELICPPDNDFTPASNTWKMMMRNVYAIGVSNVSARALDVAIENRSFRENADVDSLGISYLRIFGLDLLDENTTPPSAGADNRIDDDPAVLNLDVGYIMFPWPEPFDIPEFVVSSYLNDTLPPEDQFSYDELPLRPIVYNDENRTEIERDHQYDIVIRGGASQKSFQLPAIDIIDGSESVVVDGTRLSRGIDYDIDYSFGQITLKGDIVNEMTPDSKVTVNYQYTPLVGGGKTSLLGVGGELNLSRNSRINGTFLYNSVGTPRYKPRLGEEPTRNMAADINGNFIFSPYWMTWMANLLPLVDTDAQSSLNMSGEVAVSFPDPNTKGEAFIDDMEGIEDADQISLLRRSWYEASPVLQIDPTDPSGQTIIRRALYDDPEFDTYWYNPNRETQEYLVTSKRDMNPGLDQRENSSVTSLFLRTIDSTGVADPDKWFGVMTGFPGGLDLTTAQYIEVWVNDYQPDADRRGGVLHIDFGRIDEDFHNPDAGEWDDERDPETKLWDAGRDDGFADETCEYPSNINAAYDSDLDLIPNINCRGKNGYQDSEDLNKNGTLDESNAFWSIEVPLSSTALIDVQRDFDKTRYSEYWFEGDQNNNLVKSWRMYRIDLSEAQLVSPTGAEPRQDAIQHMRVWVDKVDSLDGVRWQFVEIGGMKIVGNRWEYNGIRDLEGDLVVTPAGFEVKIGSINNKEAPDSLYRSPYTVDQEEGIENREQSLLLGFENLPDTTKFQAVKRFFGEGQNYEQYREAQFFVYPDVDDPLDYAEGETIYECYLQFAYDSNNYYEVAIPFVREDMRRWLFSTVNLADLTNLKIGQVEDTVSAIIADAVDPNRSYVARIKGDPTFFKVRYLFAGVRNSSGGTIRGGSVYVNDIKLGGVRRDIDHAERVSVSANFANVLQLSASVQRTGPEFRSLRQKAGSGVTNLSIAMQGKTKLNHFIPTLGFDIPVTAKMSQSRALPKYFPSSDIEIKDEAVRDSLRSVNNARSYSVSLSRSGSENWLMKHVFDNLRTSVSWSKTTANSPRNIDTTYTMSGNLNYTVHFRKDRQLSLFKGIKWRWWLSNFSYQGSASRTKKKALSWSSGEFVARPNDYNAQWDNEISTLYDPFESLKLSFNMREHRVLQPNDLVGQRTEYSHNIMLQFKPGANFPILSQFTPDFEYRGRYREDLRPTIRQGDDPFGTRDAWADRNISIRFDLDMGRYFGGIGRFFGILEKGEGGDAAARRRGTSTRELKQDFKKWLDEQNKPASSDKSGQKESIFDQEGSAPPPATSPSTPSGSQTEPPGTSRPASLGISRPTETKPAATDTTAAVADSTAAADTTEASKYNPMLLPRQIFLLLSRIDPVRASIRIDRSSYYQRLYERAGFAYQLALTDDAAVSGKSGETEHEPVRANSSLVMDFNTGVDLTSNLDVDVRLSIARSSSDVEGTTTNETERITWPSLTFRWQGLEKVGFLARYITQSDLTMKFERKTQKTARKDQVDILVGPNWNLTWKNALTSNLALTYNQSDWEEASEEFWKKSWSVSLDLKYDFERSEGFSVPLPWLNKKKIKFTSKLTTGMNLSYSSSSSFNSPASTVITVAPRANYRFSRRITGSITGSYSRTAGGILGYVYHRVGLHVQTEFTF